MILNKQSHLHVLMSDVGPVCGREYRRTEKAGVNKLATASAVVIFNTKFIMFTTKFIVCTATFIILITQNSSFLMHATFIILQT